MVGKTESLLVLVIILHPVVAVVNRLTLATDKMEALVERDMTVVQQEKEPLDKEQMATLAPLVVVLVAPVQAVERPPARIVPSMPLPLQLGRGPGEGGCHESGCGGLRRRG
jgi:hypothetical protein